MLMLGNNRTDSAAIFCHKRLLWCYSRRYLEIRGWRGGSNIVEVFLIMQFLVWRGKHVGYRQNFKFFTLTPSFLRFLLPRGYVPSGTKLKSLWYWCLGSLEPRSLSVLYSADWQRARRRNTVRNVQFLYLAKN